MKDLIKILEGNEMMQEIVREFGKGDWEIGISLEDGKIVEFNGVKK